MKSQKSSLVIFCIVIDKVRTLRGAVIPATSGTGLTQAQALEEIHRERRVALVFRGTSFYDAHRWVANYDLSKGGVRTGAAVLSSTGVLNTNARIKYDFLDYRDVQDDEVNPQLNPPATGSAPVKTPE